MLYGSVTMEGDNWIRVLQRFGYCLRSRKGFQVWFLYYRIELEKEHKRKVDIYVDGGIWKGSDIFKCLALGADFVFIGRAFLYSLVEGEKGINNCFDMLTHELKNTMILCGTHNISDINQSYIFNSPSKL